MTRLKVSFRFLWRRFWRQLGWKGDIINQLNIVLTRDGDITTTSDITRSSFSLIQITYTKGSKRNIPCCALLARQVHATFASDSRMWRASGAKCHSVSISQCFPHCLVNDQKQARHVSLCAPIVKSWLFPSMYCCDVYSFVSRVYKSSFATRYQWYFCYTQYDIYPFGQLTASQHLCNPPM
jgi:hypothetical protein